MVAAVYLLGPSGSTKQIFYASVTKDDTVLADCRCLPLSPFCFGRKCLCFVYRSSLCPYPCKFSEGQASSDICIREKNLDFNVMSFLTQAHILCWKPEVCPESKCYPRRTWGGKPWREEDDHEQPCFCLDSLQQILSCIITLRSPFQRGMEDGRGAPQLFRLPQPRPSLQFQLLVKQVFVPFFCFQKCLFFFLGSHTFCIVKISWLCPYWRKSGLRGNQSVKSLSAGTFRWALPVRALPAQEWQQLIVFV